jgi:hypothetical protein
MKINGYQNGSEQKLNLPTPLAAVKHLPLGNNCCEQPASVTAEDFF